MFFEKPRFSKADYRTAGKRLAQIIPASGREEAAEWFRIAHNWRSSHVFPMRQVRLKLSAHCKPLGAVTAARLKRMQSIRKKLCARSLHQIQDIAGCRAILPASFALHQVLDEYIRGRSGYEVFNYDDYVKSPRASGYRGHHLILKFRGSGSRPEYDGMRVELQLRTQLQHAWATAVEAVGLYRNEDLKGGQGDQDWLRFFKLMAAEAAHSENCPLIPGTPLSKRERRDELEYLDKRLQAESTLESFRQALYASDDLKLSDAKHYLIQFDQRRMSVDVRPYFSWSSAAVSYDENDLESMPRDAVLVEVDKVSDLKKAYPNYFLDVAAFAAGLRRVLKNKDVRVPTLELKGRSKGI